MMIFALIIVVIILSSIYQSSSLISLSSSLSLRTSLLSTRNYQSSRCISQSPTNTLNHGRFFHLKMKPLLATMERVSVGDALTAEVNDVKGSISDPIVEFTIKKTNLKATMPTKNLSMTERLALTTGSIMQVYVTKVEDDNIQVSLKSTSESSNQSMKKPRSFNDNDVISKSTKGKKNQIRNSADVPGTLLNNLKTGMRLEGKVVSSSHYGAFIEAKIFRASKGGSFKEIVGLLNKNDVILNGKKNKLSTQEVLSNGAPIAVYVKEVWKNSGRFTLTMDPTISKAKILELKKITQIEGRERRRARRLRRQLTNVVQGQTVTGVVQKIIPDGVLVTINSLGALNVTGLISKKDLPKQFEVPAEMKESFQRQLLEQDFVEGRQITCGVLAVNNKIVGISKISAPTQYNLKLLYEEMGAMPVMEEINLDGIDLIDDSSLKAVKKDDEEDVEDDDYALADDVKEIYDELRGSNDYLPAEDLKDWEDIQDMLESGEITMETIDKALEEVHVGRNGMINFMQFTEIVEILQDELDGVYASNDDDDNDDNEIDSNNSIANTKMKSPLSTTTLESKDELSQEDDEWNDTDDMKEIAREIFDELREDSVTLSVANFKKWEDVKDLISTKAITSTKLDEAIKKVGVSKTITFDQFYQLVEIMDDLAADADDSKDDDFEVLSGDGFGKKSETKQDKSDALSSRSSKLEMSASDDGAKSKKKAEPEVVEEDDEDDDQDEEDDEEFKDLIKNDFDQLKGKNGKVSPSSFKKWEEVENMIDSGAIDNKTVDDCIATVMDRKKGDMTFEQFYEVVILLDEAAEDNINANEEGIEDDEDDDEEEDDDDEDEPTEEEIEEMAREIFDELKSPKSGKVTVKKFKAWDGVKEVIASGELEKEALNDILETAGVTTDLSFEQFKEIMDLIEAAMISDDDEEEEEKEVVVPKGFGTKSAAAAKQPEPVMSEEDEAAAVAKEIFDELRGKRKTLSVKAFKEWEELEVMIEDQVVKHSTIEKGLNKAGCLETGEITLKQFTKVMDYINENMDLSKLDLDGMDDEEDDEDDRSKGFGVSENSRVMKVDDDDDDVEDNTDDEDLDDEITEEEAAKEIFDELKPKKSETLPIAKFIQWGDVQELLESGALSKDNLAKAIENVGVTDDKSQLTFDMFFDLIQIIEEYIDQEKVPIDMASDVVFEKRVHVENDNDVDSVMNLLDGLMEDDNGDTKVSYVKNGKTSEGNAALSKMKEDIIMDDNEDEDDEDDDEDSDDDDEIAEMFEELSKGKSYITEKALRKWDELQEILEAGLVTKETIDDYFKRLNIKDGRVSVDQFTSFIEMLDTVLVDDEGNFLSPDDLNSVDLSDIDDAL